MAGGMVFLGEHLSLQFIMASVLVLGGVAISVLPLQQMIRRSSGS
jgi:drug/metabolite transporter (DMT)-like permease